MTDPAFRNGGEIIDITKDKAKKSGTILQ